MRVESRQLDALQFVTLDFRSEVPLSSSRYDLKMKFILSLDRLRYHQVLGTYGKVLMYIQAAVFG